MRRVKVYVAAGYNTTYFGPGRPEFNPKAEMPTFDLYLKEAAYGTCSQVANPVFDEGVIGSFMPGRFLKQAHLPAFLPAFVPSLLYKPCTGVEGACGTGGRAIATAIRSILSGMAESVFVMGFEVQNTMKPVYGADVLAGASYYSKERKSGHAYFFPGVFADRAGAYYAKYGYEETRFAMAQWYEQMIQNARKCPKAQEYQNLSLNLYELGMTAPNPEKFLPHLNHYDCSKVSDGASSLLVLSEKGLKKCGIKMEDAVEIVALGEAQDDITKPPKDPTEFTTTRIAFDMALKRAEIDREDLALLEVHDCFTISAIQGLEAMGFAEPGKGPDLILKEKTEADSRLPVNLSGGLIGFGHPTGATGVRQLVDLQQQLTGCAQNQITPRTPYGAMVSMGGNDKTVTAIIVKTAKT